MIESQNGYNLSKIWKFGCMLTPLQWRDGAADDSNPRYKLQLQIVPFPLRELPINHIDTGVENSFECHFANLSLSFRTMIDSSTSEKDSFGFLY